MPVPQHREEYASVVKQEERVQGLVRILVAGEDVHDMNVTVDGSRCQGHARCNLIAPDVFDLDEQGNAVVMEPDVSEEHRSDVESAILNCPENAISAR